MKRRTGHTTEDAPHRTPVGIAVRLAEAGEYEKALHALAKGGSGSPEVTNARGVCLMRLQRASDAVQVLRPLVLEPGSTWMKRDLPVIYRTNFATALLLGGHKLGGRDALIEIGERAHPSRVRLADALRLWERELSWWQRLLWKLGVEPDLPVTIDFLPGDFVDPLESASKAPARSHG